MINLLGVFMAIENIDQRSCIGCGVCVRSCPCDVIRMDESSSKAIIRYPEDCMLCELCSEKCPVNAIYVSPEKKSPLLLSWG